MQGTDMKHKKKIDEIVRFFTVGILATGIQYGTYLLMIGWLHPLVANTFAYLVSFTFNYAASVRYTFQVKSTTKRYIGFAFSHVINYLLQTGCLHAFLGLGLSKQTAMLPMFAVCVPINFLLVRFFLHKE
ncbi:outer membrane insertion signal domain protein [Prevotella denticola CRIS 18C-A]|uniref:Outer membrane insertion signal domain protein n=2 Tax=Prevotella denticola TaxID=28129 RepID=F0H5A4_9BACT|nr:outer membrane insertion signal domain protein [Prevotella denticola CRIS 18C-A]